MSLKRIRIVALIFAIVAAISFYFIYSDWAAAQENAEPDQGETASKVTVVVAAVDIKPYTTITAEMLDTKELIWDPSVTAYFASVDDVVGQIAKADIFAAEVLTPRRIAEPGDVSLGLAHTLEEGKRAITVNVDNETGVASMIKVGNFVDLIYMSQVGGENAAGQQLSAARFFEALEGLGKPGNTSTLHYEFGNDYTMIAMQRLKIAAVDSVFYKDDTKQSYASVTFEVTPSEATQLALLADGSGSIRLALRAQEDETLADDPRGEAISGIDD